MHKVLCPDDGHLSQKRTRGTNRITNGYARGEKFDIPRRYLWPAEELVGTHPYTGGRRLGVQTLS